jgi:hypothetical protein
MVTALQPPAAPAKVSALAYEPGSCGSRLHATRKTLRGPRAFCDDSLVLTPVPGRFSVAAEASCQTCAALVAQL